MTLEEEVQQWRMMRLFRRHSPPQCGDWRGCTDLGAPPPGLDPLGAWTALQGNRSGYTEDVAGVARATFQRGAVSLPQGNAGEVPVETVLPEPLQKLLGGASGFLRSSAAAAEALAAVGVARTMDLKLARRGHDHGEFIGQLCDKGIVEPCSECA